MIFALRWYALFQAMLKARIPYVMKENKTIVGDNLDTIIEREQSLSHKKGLFLMNDQTPVAIAYRSKDDLRTVFGYSDGIYTIQASIAEIPRGITRATCTEEDIVEKIYDEPVYAEPVEISIDRLHEDIYNVLNLISECRDQGWEIKPENIKPHTVSNHFIEQCIRFESIIAAIVKGTISDSPKSSGSKQTEQQ
jgi:hypothetical protein